MSSAVRFGGDDVADPVEHDQVVLETHPVRRGVVERLQRLIQTVDREVRLRAPKLHGRAVALEHCHEALRRLWHRLCDGRSFQQSIEGQGGNGRTDRAQEGSTRSLDAAHWGTCL